MAENEQLQTRPEAGVEEAAEKTTKPSSKKGGKKTPQKAPKKTSKKAEPKAEPKADPKPEKPKGKSFQETMIRDSETAKQRGHNGGVKSGEVRRAKRDARESIQYLLGQMTKSESIRSNLKELGAEETEFTNLLALHGRLFSMAMSGNLEAYMTLMKMGGYEPEELRKERESLASDRRRDLEVDAKVAALGQGKTSEVAVNFPDEDGDNDVVIYMPQIDSEESCEVEPETPVAEETAE